MRKYSPLGAGGQECASRHLGTPRADSFVRAATTVMVNWSIEAQWAERVPLIR